MLFATPEILNMKIWTMKQFILFIFILLLNFPVLAGFSDSLQSQKEQIDAEIKIYPNPVINNQVTISFETKTFVGLRLVSITGKEIIKEKYDFPKYKTILRLQDVPNGIYILQIKTDNQLTIAKKIMISKE